MKTLISTFISSAFISLIIMGCEHPISMQTKVHEDGSLDKVIEIDKADSASLERNIFNISQSKGWKVDIRRSDSDSTTSRDEFKIRFEKSFTSSEEFNEDLNNVSDTLFGIQSKFEKSFRWFYTYIRYSETFKKVDRLKKVKSEDYFNEEDLSFLKRLPGEGEVISKADSFYLQKLNERIFQDYGRMGMFLEHLDVMAEVIKKNIGANWVDSLYKESDFIFSKLDDMEGDIDFEMKMMDSLNIPVPKEKAALDLHELGKGLNSRIAFMGYARDGKYTNSIEMPWSIVKSNADSIAGNNLYWKPLVTKFSIQDYEMYVEARKLNWWVVIVSVVILSFSGYVFFRRKKG